MTISQMSESVKKILQDHAVGVGDRKSTLWVSHVSMVQPKGKFAFNLPGWEKFWELYSDAIIADKSTIFGIAEKPQEQCPVIADIDIKIENPDDGLDLSRPLYSDEQALEVIQIYQRVLRKIVEGCTDEQLTCVLLEKPPYQVSTNLPTLKSGLHLHFPNIFMSASHQRVHLNARVKDELMVMETFSDFVEDSSTVIDDVVTKPWLLYGSRKSESSEPYRVSRVYDHNCEEISLENAFGHYQIFDLNQELIDIRGKVEYYLPRILSVIPHNRRVSITRRGLISPLKEKAKMDRIIDNSRPDVSVVEALKMSAKLVPMLSDRRAGDRDEWMEIGWALFAVGAGCPEALDQWLQFSSRCEDKFDEAECIHEWSKMVKKNYTLGTLNHLARIDSPDQYRELKKEEANYHMREALVGSHNDIAKVLYANYGNDFVCGSIASSMWFQFCNHKWKQIEAGTFLREKISGEIVKGISEMGQSEIGRLSETIEKTNDGGVHENIKRITKVIGNCKSAPYKNNVMREAEEVFYDERFREKLDQDPMLVAFQNGVYDLARNIFRAGRPEDFISKALPIDYINYCASDWQVQEVHDFFEKVFPDPSIREYFLDIYSDIFVGGNSRKIVLFWTGAGNNAKSVTQAILEKMLGELSIKFSTTLLSGKKIQSGSANPELARAGPPVRSAVLEEPDNDERLGVGLLKSLSGEDSYWARDLFEPGKAVKEVTPMFTLTFICNKLPKLAHSDEATWDRIKVVPFETTFVRPGMPCPETHEEQLKQKRFPMDLHFKAKLPDLLPAFAWVLLEHRKKPKTNYEPEKVREATNHYRRQNDIYRQFIQEKVIEDDNSSINVDELNSAFRIWFKEGFPNQSSSLPDRDFLKEYFNTCWHNLERNKWQGYRIRTLEDDINDGEAIPMDENDDEENGPPM
jgi:phage/plasmid-associated DNA primase